MATVARGGIGNSYFGGTLLSVKTCTGLRLAEVQYEVEKSCAEHKHETAFFSLLLQGRYVELRGNERMQYEVFDLGFHPKETVHSDAVQVGPARFFLIEIPESWDEYLREHPSALDAKSRFCRPPAAWLAADLYREYREANLDCPLLIESIVSQLLSSLTTDPMVGAGVRPRWLSRVMDLLQNEFQNKVTLQQVAQEVDLHPVHLSRAFRRYCGESLGEFVSRLRVQFAQKKICDLEASLVDVALLAGFADQSQFTRTFRRYTGFTPGAFRRAAGLANSTRNRSGTKPGVAV